MSQDEGFVTTFDSSGKHADEEPRLPSWMFTSVRARGRFNQTQEVKLEQH